MLIRSVEGNRYRPTLGQRVRRGVAAGTIMFALALGGCATANADGGIPGSGTASGPSATATATGEPTATVYPTVTGTVEPTATAYPTSPKTQPTPFGNQTISDIPLGPGQCIDLQPGDPTGYIVTGDVLVGSDVNNLQRGYDNRGDTGMLLTIGGTQQATVCAEFGADVIVIQGANPSTVNTQAELSYQDLRRNGCESNAGCAGGVQEFGYANGVLTYSGLRRD